jgi:hypothetical protein
VFPRPLGHGHDIGTALSQADGTVCREAISFNSRYILLGMTLAMYLDVHG